jgi:glycosyltransferase involved in cell wall biosynthesis
MTDRPITVAWLSYFPVEWLPDAPAEVRQLPRMHPASWQRVLLGELEKDPGLRIHVFVLRKQFPRDQTFTRNGVTFHLIKTAGGWRAPTLFWLDTWLIRRRLAEVRPDVLHAWGTEQGAALVASRLGKPFVATVQGLFTWIRELVPLNRYQRFAAHLENWSLPRAPVLTAESSHAVRFIRDRWPGARVQQVEHAPDWLFHQLERRPSTTPRRFLFVGGLSHIKGTDILLLALDQLRNEIDFNATLVGSADAGFLESLRQKTSPVLWERVRLREHLTPIEVAEEMQRATLMIFPTRADTSPNSVKEAAVAGLPVVASAIGGIPDYIFPQRNGILFTPGSVPACVDAIRKACADPRLGTGQVDAATLASVRDYLSPRRMADRFRQIYRALAASGTRKSPITEIP